MLSVCKRSKVNKINKYITTDALFLYFQSRPLFSEGKSPLIVCPDPLLLVRHAVSDHYW